MESNWYVLQVISGKEKSVLRNLEFVQSVYEKTEEKKDIIRSIRVPEEDVYEANKKTGKKKLVKRKILPGYILIELAFPDDLVEAKKVYSDIVMANGVGTFIGGRKDGLPVPVTDQEIEDLLMRMGELKKTVHKPSPTVYFDVGEKVKVIEGPFKDLSGKIETVDMEKQKIRVKIEIFGMPTPVDLDIWQVEKL